MRDYTQGLVQSRKHMSWCPSRLNARLRAVKKATKKWLEKRAQLQMFFIHN